jgi:phage internal scaffolding protein
MTKHISEIIPEVFKTHFKHDTLTVSFKDSPSKAQQEFKDEVNINNIVDRALTTGVMPSGNRQPLFDDFSEVHDYETVVDIVNNAETSFEALPSSTREKFGNDVTALLDFIDNPENKEEAVKLGLISDKPEYAPEPYTHEVAAEETSAPTSDETSESKE